MLSGVVEGIVIETGTAVIGNLEPDKARPEVVFSLEDLLLSDELPEAVNEFVDEPDPSRDIVDSIPPNDMAVITESDDQTEKTAGLPFGIIANSAEKKLLTLDDAPQMAAKIGEPTTTPIQTSRGQHEFQVLPGKNEINARMDQSNTSPKEVPPPKTSRTAEVLRKVVPIKLNGQDIPPASVEPSIALTRPVADGSVPQNLVAHLSFIETSAQQIASTAVQHVTGIPTFQPEELRMDQQSSLQSPNPAATIGIRPQLNPPAIIAQITATVSTRSSETVELRLDPPELGRVTVIMSHTDTSVTAQVIAEKSEVAELLKRHTELLSKELSKSGFDESTLEFSHRNPSPQQQVLIVEEYASFELADQTSDLELATSRYRPQNGALDIRL